MTERPIRRAQRGIGGTAGDAHRIMHVHLAVQRIVPSVRDRALPTGDTGVLLRTDNALVYASELYHRLVKSYGLHQEFILPHTPEQNGIAESFKGTFNIECVWQHRFKTYAEAKVIITVLIRHYNETRRHSRLGYLAPAAWR